MSLLERIIFGAACFCWGGYTTALVGRLRRRRRERTFVAKLIWHGDLIVTDQPRQARITEIHE